MMLESIRVTEKLHWPEQELSKKSVLSPEENNVTFKNENGLHHLSSGILKDIFTTGTSSYNVLLQSKEEKKHHSQKLSSAHHKRHRKSTKSSVPSRSNEHRKIKAPLPLLSSGWYYMDRQPSIFITSPVSSDVRFTHSISVAGNSIGLPPRPKSKAKKHYFSSLTKPKQPQFSKGHVKEVDVSGRKLCILTAIKPLNVEKEKIRFFKSDFTYNPQFEYANPALPNVLAKHSQASDKFLKQGLLYAPVLWTICTLLWHYRIIAQVFSEYTNTKHSVGVVDTQIQLTHGCVVDTALPRLLSLDLSVNIMERTLQKYGSYEKFEQATGGSLLPKSRIWNHVRKYMVKEGCLGEIVVHLTEDLLSRASMTVVNGRPTLTINVSTAREHWLEGMLRHEIGTHYFRGINNNSQPWCNWNGRKKLGLKPINPTEEGLASIHSVLFRKDPFLWRAALLYYTVYQASRMSFSQLFQDVGRFVKDPNTRWDYCVRAKRGWTDTSQPGCFSKDQVYLDGILQILRYRESIDFHLLMALGKISYEDVDRLKEFAVIENMRVPHFLHDPVRYMGHLEKIMEVNELTDKELQDLIL